MDIFYRAVVQAVLLFGSERWVLSAAMDKRLEGVYVVFFLEVIGKTARRQWDGTWKMEGG